jgi:hypothetical protein
MRRTVMKVASISLACLYFVAGMAAGAVFLTAPTQAVPLSRWHDVAYLPEVPVGGPPQRLPIIVPRYDAWTRLPPAVAGVIFLRRTSDGELIALRAEHGGPLRIPVVFDAQSDSFRSLCRRVAFNLDGEEIPVGDVPLIGENLQKLPTVVRGDSVWVRYD